MIWSTHYAQLFATFWATTFESASANVGRGSRLICRSVVNSGSKTIELVRPGRNWLANQVRPVPADTVGRTVQQLPVNRYQISDRRLEPRARRWRRHFQRPSIKQSNETLFLQIADSRDRPANVSSSSFPTHNSKGEQP
jgi:hypothetical protein